MSVEFLITPDVYASRVPTFFFLPVEYHNYNFSATEYEPVEKRQLYAFPRVGRSESRDPARRTVEQAGMWFGPRVGRSDPTLQENVNDFQAMPVRRNDQPGMWFGPRLGRSFKSDDDGEVTHFSKICEYQISHIL